MTVESFNKGIDLNENRIQTKVVLETASAKEVRIFLPKGQVMKEHKTPYPILIFIVDGHIELGVDGNNYLMQSHDIIALEGHVVHHLVAKEDTIVRLTLSKFDQIERVNSVVNGL